MPMPYQRHVGEAREDLARQLAEAYKTGASIRELAEDHAFSYGKVHRILSESGVELRGRGGDARRGGLSKLEAFEYRQRLAGTRRR